MPRLYTVSFHSVSVSAVQDLICVPGVSNKIVRVLRIYLSYVDTLLATAQMLKLRCQILPATFTQGTGGTTSITPSKKDQGDAASSITTAATNCTSQASTNGTAVTIWTGGCHLYNGIDRRFDTPIPIIPTAGFAFQLVAAPSGSVTLSGCMDISEEG